MSNCALRDAETRSQVIGNRLDAALVPERLGREFGPGFWARILGMSSMSLKRMAAVMVLPISLALGLAGCDTKQDTGLAVGAVAGGLLGNTVGKGTGKVLATVGRRD